MKSVTKLLMVARSQRFETLPPSSSLIATGTSGWRAGTCEEREHPEDGSDRQQHHERQPAREDAEGDAGVADVPEREARHDVDRLADAQDLRITVALVS